MSQTRLALFLLRPLHAPFYLSWPAAHFRFNICGPLSVRSIPTIAPPSLGDTDRQVEFSIYTLLLKRRQLDS